MTIHELSGFDDPVASEEGWNALLSHSNVTTVFQTRAWLRSWWSVLGRGDLLLLLVTRDGEPSLLAPLFVEGGMAFPIGSGGSDYLDLVGTTGAADATAALLEAVASRVPDFVGIRMYHLRDDSPTAAALQEAAIELGWQCVEEAHQVAPFMGITDESIADAVSKKSLVRHQRWFEREGALEVIHSQPADEIAPHLESFFTQHIDRWAGTPHPSLFLDAQQCEFYRELVAVGAAAGWLRFTRIVWEGRTVAYHLGFSYHGSYMWYKPTFDIALARRSPGEVLLRQLLLAAHHEGVGRFDFGLGDEPFKARFATGRCMVRDLGIYPKGAS